jgi:hypothetical protein
MQYNMDNVEESIPLLIKDWNNLKTQLEILYKKRDVKSTLPLMEKGINLFIQFLFWSNEQSVPPKEIITSIRMLNEPVNVEERLAFIQSRPSLYQSFRQLCELMLEQEKIYVKLNIKRKASRTDV